MRIHNFARWSVSFIVMLAITAGCQNPSGDTSLSGPKAGDSLSYDFGAARLILKYCPGGTFSTGIDDDSDYNNDGDKSDPGEGDQTIAAFWIGETEVTYELWSFIYVWATDVARGAEQYFFQNAGNMGDGAGVTNQHPVTFINWRDAIVFCNAITEYANLNHGAAMSYAYTSDSGYTTPIRDSSDGAFSNSVDYPNPGSFDDPYLNPNASGFRLPKNMEWECAARYINGTDWTPGNFASGANVPHDTADDTTNISSNDVALYDTNSAGSTASVKSKTPSSLGLYDMSGNNNEWCYEYYPGLPGTSRLRRGGNILNGTDSLRVGAVQSYFPYYSNTVIGLRICQSL